MSAVLDADVANPDTPAAAAPIADAAQEMRSTMGAGRWAAARTSCQCAGWSWRRRAIHQAGTSPRLARWAAKMSGEKLPIGERVTVGVGAETDMTERDG